MKDKNLVKELEEEFRMFDAEDDVIQVVHKLCFGSAPVSAKNAQSGWERHKRWELHLERIRESKNQEEENVNKLRLVKELEEAFQQFYGGSMGRLVIR